MCKHRLKLYGYIMLFKFFEHMDRYLQSRTKREIYMLYFSIILVVIFIVYMWLEPFIATYLERNKQAFDKVSKALINNQSSFKNAPSSPQSFMKKVAISQRTTLEQNLQTLKPFFKSHYDLLEKISSVKSELGLNIISDILMADDLITLSLCGDFENLVEFMRRIETDHFIFLQDFRLSFLKNEMMAEGCKKDNPLSLWLRIKNLGIFL